MDYDKLAIQCRACQSWKHKVSDCKEIHKRPMKGTRRPQVHHTHNQIINKNIVIDQDCFQHVRNMKHTRRNIFDTVGEDARVHIFEQEGEIRIEQHNHNQRSRIYDNNQNVPNAHNRLNNRPARQTNKGLGNNEEAQE